MAKSRICVTDSEDYPLCVGIDSFERAYFSKNSRIKDTPESWSDIVELSAGHAHILALDRFGKAHAVGDNTYGQCDVGAWVNIASVHACGNLSVASRINGTVAVSNSNGRLGLEDWLHIKKVCTDGSRLIIMKTGGTVVEIGEEDKIRGNTSSWKNIIDIVACNGRAIGLADDGTVMVVGTDFNPNRWKDIIAVAANRNNIIGLKQDGKVVFDGISEFGEKQVEEWVGIVDISAQNGYCLGVRLNGTVVAAGRNDNGQCNVEDWHNVVAVYAAKTCAFGLCADGSVLCTDSKTYGGLENWKLFDDIDILPAEISYNWVHRQAWKTEDRCRYCGGEFKGLFGKKCASCGFPKDY